MSEEKNKFKVGDVVVNLNEVSFWNNIYHFDKFISSFVKKEVVKQVAHGRFTTSDEVDLSKYEDREDWRKQYSIYGLSNGKSEGGFKTMHNWTTNKKNIVAYLENLFKEEIEKCQREDDEMIARLEAEIRQKQAKIEQIRAGNRGISFKSEVNERDFVNGQIDKIREIMKSF